MNLISASSLARSPIWTCVFPYMYRTVRPMYYAVEPVTAWTRRLYIAYAVRFYPVDMAEGVYLKALFELRAAARA